MHGAAFYGESISTSLHAFNLPGCDLPPALLWRLWRFAAKCSQRQATLQSARSRLDCGRVMCLLAFSILRLVSSYNKYSLGKSTHEFRRMRA